MKETWQGLLGVISDLPGAVVAFSGGVDSTLVLRAAIEALGPDRVAAATAVSETYLAAELTEARRIADLLGADHVIVDTSELSDARFSSNPPERCYYCKSELYLKLSAIAAAGGKIDNGSGGGHWAILDGSNLDDIGDFRPGRKASAEAQVRSPLLEAGITKATVRELSRWLDLPTWDKPAAACLASRFPYGEKIDSVGLKRVAAAEDFLRKLGFNELRVRSHGSLARIEVDKGALDSPAFSQKLERAGLVQRFKELGYNYITLDLEGYRMGSMNEVLEGISK